MSTNFTHISVAFLYLFILVSQGTFLIRFSILRSSSEEPSKRKGPSNQPRPPIQYYNGTLSRALNCRTILYIRHWIPGSKETKYSKRRSNELELKDILLSIHSRDFPPRLFFLFFFGHWICVVCVCVTSKTILVILLRAARGVWGCTQQIVILFVRRYTYLCFPT